MWVMQITLHVQNRNSDENALGVFAINYKPFFRFVFSNNWRQANWATLVELKRIPVLEIDTKI